MFFGYNNKKNIFLFYFIIYWKDNRLPIYEQKPYVHGEMAGRDSTGSKSVLTWCTFFTHLINFRLFLFFYSALGTRQPISLQFKSFLAGLLGKLERHQEFLGELWSRAETRAETLRRPFYFTNCWCFIQILLPWIILLPVRVMTLQILQGPCPPQNQSIALFGSEWQGSDVTMM